MPDGVCELLQCVEEHFPQMGIQVCCFDRTYFAKENARMAHFRRLTGIPNLVRHYRDVEEPIAKIVFGTDEIPDILEMEKLLRSHPLADKFDFIRSERTLYEILPRGVHKGLALGKLTEHLGASVRHTVAVGDYNNDIGMFRAAGVGIAVANACPEALAAADAVTVSNEEHAIAHVIADLEQGVYSL